VLLLTVACGGGGGGGATEGAFVQHGNQLCKALADDYQAGKAALPSPASAADIKDFVQGRFVPEAVQTYQQIAGLKMPGDQADAVNALLTAAIAEVRLIQSDPAAGGSPQNQRDLVKRFQEVGLTECGAGFQHELNQAQFIEAVNGICQGLGEKVLEIGRDRQIDQNATSEALAQFVQQTVLPLFTDVIAQIDRLGFPTDAGPDWAKLVSDWKADVVLVQQNPLAFYDQTRPAAVDINQRWIAYGATSCGVWK